MKRSLWTVAFLILVAAESAHAQCDWTTQSGNIVTMCGSGIGTTTPSAFFHVKGSIGQFMLVQRGTKGLYVNANWSGNDLWAQIAPRQADNMGLSLSSNDNAPEYLFIAPSGKVGIGTITPAEKFHIFNGTTTGAVAISTPLNSSFPVSSPIGGLRLAWQYAGTSNNVDFQVIRGLNAIDGAGLGIFTSPDSTHTLERVRITSAGNVGIGLPDPSQPLEVAGNVRVRPVTGSFSVGGGAPAGYHFYAQNTTAGQSAALQLRGNFSGFSTSYFANLGSLGTFISTNREPQQGGYVDGAASPNQANAVTVAIGDTLRGRLFQVANFPSATENVRFLVDYAGNVGIGTLLPAAKLHVEGNIHVSGNINAKYQDVAEWVPASSDLEAGTVVVLNPERDNEVMASSRAYDTTVAGVVSAQPGLTLGERADTKETIATMGRVRVRVDARKAPIAVGDLLVTSDQPGVAMKSVPVDVSGIAMHRPGTIVGKALQPLAGGTGEILVLLSLQ